MKRFYEQHLGVFRIVKALFRVFSIFVIFVIFSVFMGLLYPLIQSILPGFINIEGASAGFSIVSISFTILGFGLTLKNIILSKDSVSYNVFTIKAIIEEGNNKISSYSWYLIICIPFYSLVIYALGYRKQLFFFVFLSASAFIIHFFTIILRLDKKNCKKIVAYIIIHSLFDKDKRTAEYRKEVFQKLVNSDNGNSESNLIFSEAVNILFKIITGKEPYICKSRCIVNRFYRSFNRNAIQKKIKTKWDNFSEEEKVSTIKAFSLFAFDYFSGVIKNSDKSEYNYIIVQFSKLIEEYIEINFREEKYTKLYLKTIQTIQIELLNKLNQKNRITYIFSETFSEILINQTEEQKEFYKKINLYTLLLNYLLGLYSACIINMSLSKVKELQELICKIILEKNVYLSKSVIDLLVLYAIYYAKYNNIINEDTLYKELETYIMDLLKTTSFMYTEYIESQIYEDFTAFDYINYIHEIYKIIEFDKNNHRLSIIELKEDIYV